MKSLIYLPLAFLLAASLLAADGYTGSFDLIATQNYPNGNVRSDTISYYLGTNKTAIVIHGRRNNPDMRIVFNTLDSTITSLYEMNGKKSGYVLPMDELHWPGMPQSLRRHNTGTHTEVIYSGKEKIIEGYTCKQATAESDEYTASLWLAEDLPLSMTRVLAYQSVGKGKSKKEIELFDQLGVKGLPLELYLKSKNGKANVILHFINFNDTFDISIFSSEGHTLIHLDDNK